MSSDPKTPIPDPQSSIRELNRIRWQCRRGMLELDLILARFLETEYSNLSGSLKEEFRALLELEDPELWTAICGPQQPRDADAASVLTMLRRSNPD